MRLNFKTILIISFVVGLIGGGSLYFIKNKQEAKQEQFPDLESSFTEDKDIVSPIDTTPLEEDFVKLSKEEQERCLQDTETMTDDELIAAVKNIRNPWGVASEVNRDRKSYTQKQLFRHFICRLRREKNEELYKKTKEFIQSWDNISEEDKEIELGWLEEVYDIVNPVYAYDNPSFSLPIAFADIDVLCSEELIEICNYGAEQEIGDIEPWLCDNMCEKIKRLLNDEEYYKIIVTDLADIGKLKLLSDIESLTNGEILKVKEISAIKTWRVALAYRIDGEESAYQICNNFGDDKQEECKDYIKETILFLKEYEGRCNNYFDSVKNEICEY